MTNLYVKHNNFEIYQRLEVLVSYLFDGFVNLVDFVKETLGIVEVQSSTQSQGG